MFFFLESNWLQEHNKTFYWRIKSVLLVYLSSVHLVDSLPIGRFQIISDSHPGVSIIIYSIQTCNKRNDYRGMLNKVKLRN